MNLLDTQKMIDAGMKLCEENEEPVLKIVLRECLTVVDELKRERERRHVVTAYEFGTYSIVQVLKAVTLREAMKEVGIPFDRRHDKDSFVFTRCHDNHSNFRITSNHHCCCQGDCCGHIYRIDYIFGRVGNSWGVEITTHRNY